MMLFSDVAATPAYELVCKPDHSQTTVNGKASPKQTKKDATFTLRLDGNDQPLAIIPANLAPKSEQIFQQQQNKPIRQGDRVLYRIGYQQLLFPASADTTLEGLNKLAHLKISGDLEVNTKNLTFQMQQTLQMQLNMNIPITEQKDINLRFKGTCIQQAAQTAS